MTSKTVEELVAERDELREALYALAQAHINEFCSVIETTETRTRARDELKHDPDEFQQGCCLDGWIGGFTDLDHALLVACIRSDHPRAWAARELLGDSVS